MLHAPGQSTGYCTIGGWWLGINKYSTNPNEPWQFMKYLISPAATEVLRDAWRACCGPEVDQQRPGRAEGTTPGSSTVVPQLHILPRPTSPVYNDISLQMQKDFHGVLDGSMSAERAVNRYREVRAGGRGALPLSRLTASAGP